jgi:hypothetical protein
MRVVLALALAAGSSHLALAADEAQRAEFSAARTFTTNVLDSPIAISDWYTALRGTIEMPVAHERGETNLTIGVEGRLHDEVRIRDTASAALTLQSTLRPTDRLELRGTLGFSGGSDGDTLDLGGLVIGTRTPRAAASIGVEAGYRIDPTLVLLAELGATAQRFGEARFQDDLLLPEQLEPDRALRRVALGARKSFGPYAAGLAASLEDRAVTALGDPPVRLSSRRIGIEATAGYASNAGAAAEIGMGAEHLADEVGLFADWRPALRGSFTLPVQQTPLELRGNARLGFETAETDDPLGSWIARAELAFAYRLAETIVAAGGVAVERRENLLLENEEQRLGLHGELTFKASKASDLVLRVDYLRSAATIIDERKQRFDILLGLRTRI